MIDPGAEWTNHSDGDDRSRVGAPTRIDLSDKGLNTSIDRRDISAGKHGMSAKASTGLETSSGHRPKKQDPG